MTAIAPLPDIHDAATLAAARRLLDQASDPAQMQREVIAAVQRNADWRGSQCINLLAPEALVSPTVQMLLSAEIGQRAAEGHIGPVNRWFAGTKHIDEVEALCVELLKRLFKANYAEHRLVASMIGNMAVYAALTQPGDTVMTIPQPVGGHSSNRYDGPAGIRGLNIVDVPYDATELTVDLDAFEREAKAARPKLIALGASMTLFPLPVTEIAAIAKEIGAKVFFDGAHQLGLIAGGQFQDPLAEGADVLTGSAGKTFSGPQSGVMVWNDPELTKPLLDAVFPALAATHQVNRVAALAAAAAELLAFGPTYMRHVVENAQTLAHALQTRGVPVLGAHKGYTTTHQVIADVREFGGGLDVAHTLAKANLITNKNLLPNDTPEDWDRPSGLRIGTTEVTRLGMGDVEMRAIADMIAGVLVEGRDPEHVRTEAVELRAGFQTVKYCFDE
ncbi:MAG TPA: serine hydroxymethyltransferase [Solirubrobacter sp.]|nr:serine hydroxymethyltransferase [Solirubrobacter sp.]